MSEKNHETYILKINLYVTKSIFLEKQILKANYFLIHRILIILVKAKKDLLKSFRKGLKTGNNLNMRGGR